MSNDLFDDDFIYLLWFRMAALYLSDDQRNAVKDNVHYKAFYEEVRYERKISIQNFD